MTIITTLAPETSTPEAEDQKETTLAKQETAEIVIETTSSQEITRTQTNSEVEQTLLPGKNQTLVISETEEINLMIRERGIIPTPGNQMIHSSKVVEMKIANYHPKKPQLIFYPK